MGKLLGSRKFRITLLVVLIVSTICFVFKQPSHNKNWQEESAILPSVEIDGDIVTIKSVRDWRYEDDGATSKNYIDKTYNLNDLEGAWIVVQLFSKIEGFAHTFFIFDFKDQEPIALSIEARREKGEVYSIILGMFKKYESIYVWGTEKDLLGRRAVWLKHRLYMYPVEMRKEFAKSFFKDLLRTTQNIYGEPQFYNSLFNNCTNAFAHSANRIQPGTIPLHIARVIPGYSEELLYKLGYIKSTDDLDALRERAFITDVVREFHNQDNFSELIREKIYSDGNNIAAPTP